MKKIVLTFGLMSGAIIAGMTAVTLPLCMNGTIPMESGQVIGYSVMVLSFLSIFFAIRSYRDKEAGGTITFGRAFKVGILVTLVGCAVYVISWEIVYYNFLPDFAETYSAHMLERLRASGASAATLAAEEVKMARFRELYKNPFFNVGMTFLEIFPVGLIVTLVSAAILRKKPGAGSPSAAVAAA
jgi:hypothetical protein